MYYDKSFIQLLHKWQLLARDAKRTRTESHSTRFSLILHRRRRDTWIKFQQSAVLLRTWSLSSLYYALHKKNIEHYKRH